MNEFDEASDPTSWPAWLQKERVDAGAIGAVELLEAHIVRIESENPVVNAIVTMDLDAAMDDARRADASSARRASLRGIPVVFKDTEQTKGMRTTFGSPLADTVPDHDAVVVERVRAA